MSFSGPLLHRRNLHFFAFCPLCLLTLALSSVAAAAEAPAPIFPALPGWKQGEIQSYGPDKLYVPIDGASDQFLRFHFELMQDTEYARGDERITVQAYRHATPLDAFGLYSQNRPAQDLYFKIGLQGYKEADYLNFLAGRYYVEMRASSTAESSLAAMGALAAEMARSLNGDAVIPAIFRAFPSQGRKPNSEKYTTQDILGYDFLHDAFQVSYSAAGKEYVLLAFKGANEADAAQMLRAFLQQVSDAPAVPEDGFLAVNDKYQGRISFLRGGRYLCCARGDLPAAEVRPLLAELNNQLSQLK
ncbi:MAG TPA: DUF6599 family protein [Opitutaceae bacterium]|nr:DUF6599 family protein [Opitutaceae bacterium]